VVNRSYVKIFATRIMQSDMLQNLFWLPTSVRKKLVTNLLLVMLTALTVFLESTECGIVGHRVAAVFSQTNIDVKDLSKIPQGTSMISRECVDRFVEAFLAEEKKKEHFSWMPAHMERSIAATVVVIVLSVLEEVFIDFRVNLIGSVVKFHLAPLPLEAVRGTLAPSYYPTRNTLEASGSGSGLCGQISFRSSNGIRRPENCPSTPYLVKDPSHLGNSGDGSWFSRRLYRLHEQHAAVPAVAKPSMLSSTLSLLSGRRFLCPPVPKDSTNVKVKVRDKSVPVVAPCRELSRDEYIATLVQRRDRLRQRVLQIEQQIAVATGHSSSSSSFAPTSAPGSSTAASATVYHKIPARPRRNSRCVAPPRSRANSTDVLSNSPQKPSAAAATKSTWTWSKPTLSKSKSADDADSSPAMRFAGDTCGNIIPRPAITTASITAAAMPATKPDNKTATEGETFDPETDASRRAEEAPRMASEQSSRSIISRKFRVLKFKQLNISRRGSGETTAGTAGGIHRADSKGDENAPAAAHQTGPASPEKGTSMMSKLVGRIGKTRMTNSTASASASSAEKTALESPPSASVLEHEKEKEKREVGGHEERKMV
jgi:hypothetical protein